jgi:hypothetical protein
MYPLLGDNVQLHVQSLYVGVVNSLPWLTAIFVAVIENAGNFISCDWYNLFTLERNDKYLILKYISMYQWNN